MRENQDQQTLLFCSTQWEKLANAYTPDTTLAGLLWQEIEQAYSSAGRYYHTLSHIRYLLEKLEEYRNQLADAVALQFSVFYHDIIYSIGRSDNEERSAEKAAASMQKLGVPAALIGKCTRQILATKTHAASPDPDTNFLTDIDLAILGEPWPRYFAYTQQIRKEYAIYPDFMYKRGRRKVLEHLLHMSSIYKTEAFTAKYEAQARKNLREELMLL